jgi:(p)ppGpp synthase/HD superfamily hydrolase
MTKEEFQAALVKYAATIEKIRQSAHELHRSVNQLYGNNLPYSYHLDKVVDEVREFGHEVCASEEDVVPMIFGGYYHDSIEDARLTYNDVLRVARKYMDKEQAFDAAEIVYALTNEKGRNRAERASDVYYAGIRSTPYAPMIKLADRFANISFSISGTDKDSDRMKNAYLKEMPHFINSLISESTDIRFHLPSDMIQKMYKMLEDEK